VVGTVIAISDCATHLKEISIEGEMLKITRERC